MKIALLIKTFSTAKGGAERYAVHLATALLDQGHEVHIFADRWDLSGRAGLVFHPVSAGSGPGFFKLIRFHRSCRKALKKEHFDIVHALTQTYPADLYRMSDGLFRHWLALQYPTPLRRFLKCLLRPVFFFNLAAERKIFEGAGCRRLIANSELCRRQAADYYAVFPDRIEVVYNGVDLERFHPGVRLFRSEVRKKQGIDEKAPLLLFAAMNFSRKGLAELIQSIPPLRASFPSICLMVVGKGDPAPYRRLARSLGVGEAVRFVGPVRDLSPFYGAADLFVLPTRYDPFANVCLEAMACGLPVVTTLQNGAAELIEEGVNGYRITSSEALDELAGKISEGLVRGASVGMRAAETARRFSQQNHVEKVIKTYQRIISEKIFLKTVSFTPSMKINRAFLPILTRNRLLSYDEVIAFDKGTLLKEIKARTILKLSLADEEKKEHLFYLKKHHASSPFSFAARRLAALFGGSAFSEGEREWNHLLAFHAAGLPTMIPVAVGEKRGFFSEESFVMTAALEGYESLERWVPSKLAALPERERSEVRRRLVGEVASLTRRMHHARLFHRDFYLTHLLFKKSSAGFDLRVIDLQRVLNRPWFSRRWKIKDLASLNYSAPLDLIGRRDRLLFYKIYRGLSRPDRADRRLMAAIKSKTEQIERHTVKMYLKREKRKRSGLLER